VHQLGDVLIDVVHEHRDESQHRREVADELRWTGRQPTHGGSREADDGEFDPRDEYPREQPPGSGGRPITGATSLAVCPVVVC